MKKHVNVHAWRAITVPQTRAQQMGEKYQSKSPKTYVSDQPKKDAVSLIGAIKEAQEGERTRQQQQREEDILKFCPCMGSSDWRIELPEQS